MILSLKLPAAPSQVQQGRADGVDANRIQEVGHSAAANEPDAIGAAGWSWTVQEYGIQGHESQLLRLYLVT